MEVLGVKPSSLVLQNAAGITNHLAMCPAVAVLAKYDGVNSVEDAMEKCTVHGCTHFTWNIAGSRSAPGDALRLHLWYDCILR